MIGLDYLVAGYVQLAAANIQCKPLKTPEISIVASDTKVKYDHTKTQKELDDFKIDTKSPYPESAQTHVGGLMSGEVSVAHRIQTMQETFKDYGQACIYVSNIEIQIHINPTIYIAKNYKKDSCMYAAVMEHEKKHIKVDRYIVNKYSRIIGSALKAAVKAIGPSQGPMKVEDIQASQLKIQGYFKDVLSQYSNEMSAERTKLQQNIDTLEEYQRVQRLCYGRL